MTKLMKLLIGGAATSLLAWGAHAAGGEKYVGGLGEKATAALADAGIAGVSVDDPTQYAPLSRVMVLSGEGLSAEQRAAAEKAVRAVPGVAGVRWAGEGADGDASAASSAASGDAPTQAAVDQCQAKVDAVMKGATITFRSGSTYMPESSLAIVDTVAAALQECDGMAVAVGGHTDSTGSTEVNQTLSQGRADAVAAALAERGIDAARITARGFGSSQLKVPGDGANEANRRIEFTLGSSGGGAGAPAAPAQDAAQGGE